MIALLFHINLDHFFCHISGNSLHPNPELTDALQKLPQMSIFIDLKAAENGS